MVCNGKVFIGPAGPLFVRTTAPAPPEGALLGCPAVRVGRAEQAAFVERLNDV